MPYFDGVRGPVYYRRWPAEAARASAVFLHGFGEHSGHYHRLAAALNHHGIDVWALDHLGHGHTGGARGFFPSVTELAGNARKLVARARASAPDLPVMLVGHSLGGVTAAVLLVEDPRAAHGLVLTGAPLDGLPAQAADLPDPTMSLDEAYLDALANDPLGFDTKPAEPALWAAISACVPSLADGFAGIPCPILLINGEHDIFAPPRQARRWAGLAANGQCVEIADGHHDILNDVPHRQAAARIVEFAAQLVSPQPAHHAFAPITGEDNTPCQR